MTSYVLGNTITVTATFTKNGTLADPVSATLKAYDPNKNLLDTVTMTAVSTGVWRGDYTPSVEGQCSLECTGTLSDATTITTRIPLQVVWLSP